MTNKNHQAEPILEEDNLTDLHISDEDLEQDDQSIKHAKKQARKLSKVAMTPEEKKRYQRKRILIVAAAVLAVILVVLLIPHSRWLVLNGIGVRSTVEFTVTESEDKIPITNSSILLDETYFTTTDSFGRAKFENVTLGKHTVVVQKNGYSKEELNLTNEISGTKSAVSLKAIGVKVNLDIRNWLTNEPIVGATVALNKDTVTSDKNGRVSIIVPPENTEKVKLQVGAAGYRSQSVPVSLSVESKEVALVSDVKHYFISRRDGKLDLFSSFIDGKNQQRIIEASGKEDLNIMQFSMHRANRFGILVANREGKMTNGRVVAGVYLVDTATATLRKIDEGSDVRLFDWADDVMVYQKTGANLNYDDPGFTQLVSFNPLNNRQKQVAQANYFSVSLVAQSKLFFAAADGYRQEANLPLTSIDLINNTQKTYLDGRLPVILTRANYDTLTVQSDDNSYHSVAVSSGQVRRIDRRVDSPIRYSLNPNGQQIVWTDKRDGRGSVFVRSTSREDTRPVISLGGITSPVRFVSDRYAVVRVVTTAESADYLVDIPTGKSSKIADVTDVQNIGLAY